MYLISRVLKINLSLKNFLCSLIGVYALNGILNRLILFRDIYKFLDFRDYLFNQVLYVAFIVGIILCGIILHVLKIRREKISITNLYISQSEKLEGVKKYRFIPFKAVKYFMVVFGIIYIILSLADMMMPQFKYWSYDDAAMFRGTKTHSMIPDNVFKYNYPVINPMLEKKPEDKIILVIGDSFIAGHGSSNSNILWWRVLNKMIQENGYTNCHVVALGICGASTYDELDWLKNFDVLKNIQPDLIIIGYVENDPEYLGLKNSSLIPEEYWPDNNIIFSGLKGHICRIAEIFFPNIVHRFGDTLRERLILLGLDALKTENKYTPEERHYKSVEGENLKRYYKFAIEPLGKFLREHNLKTFLLTTPAHPDLKKYDRLYKNVMPLFSSAGIPAFNCINDFVKKHGNDDDYYIWANPINHHPGIATNYYYADYAMKILLNNYPEVLGKKYSIKDKLNNISVSDWFPADNRNFGYGWIPQLREFPVTREFEKGLKAFPDPSQFKTLLNPVAEGRTVKFTYSDQWDRRKYLYMPMFAKTVKICFEFPVYASEFVIKDSDGNICKDFDAWCSYIGNKNYEEFDENKLNRDESGKFLNSHENITALNLHRDYKIHGEKNYFIEFK